MFALMGAAVRYSSAELPNEMIVFLRNAFGLIALLPWLYGRGSGLLRTTRWVQHLTRSLAGLAAMYCFFYAIAHLQLAEAVLLNFSAPLFIAPLAWMALGEAVSRRVGLAIVAGFFGIALVLKPGWALLSSAAPIGLLSGVLAAVAMVSIRRMSVTEPILRMVFYFSVTSTVVSALPMAWAWQTPSVDTALIMVAAGFFATQGQLLLTKSYSLAPAARIGPYTYSTVIFAAFIGWLGWQETPDGYTLAGALLVGVAGALAMTREPEPSPIMD
jgi:drug/metabolite transporter (DMT)-like permease